MKENNEADLKSDSGESAECRKQAVATHTSEHPVTPSMAPIVAQARRRYRILLGSCLGFPALGMVVMAGFARGPYPVGTVLGVWGMLAMIGALFLPRWEFPANRDLRESTYLRTAGSLVIRPTKFGWYLYIADQRILVDQDAVVNALRGLQWAVVDYSKNLNVIFAIRDQVGMTLYPLDDTCEELPQ